MRQERSESGFSRYYGGHTEAGVQPKRIVSLGQTLYSGQALVCAIPVGHMASFVHESVAQHSGKQRTVAFTACSQHGVVE